MLFLCSSDHETEQMSQKEKKEYVFTNKKDAVEAFKALLREKVAFKARTVIQRFLSTFAVD